MLRGVAVVWMPVQDIDRAKGFYRDTLGLRITNVEGEWAEVDANGLTLGLNGRGPSGAQGEGGPSLPSSPRGAWKRPSMASRPRGSRSPPVSPSIPGAAWRPWWKACSTKDTLELVSLRRRRYLEPQHPVESVALLPREVLQPFRHRGAHVAQ